jgi:hypothetical protein
MGKPPPPTSPAPSQWPPDPHASEETCWHATRSLRGRPVLKGRLELVA